MCSWGALGLSLPRPMMRAASLPLVQLGRAWLIPPSSYGARGVSASCAAGARLACLSLVLWCVHWFQPLVHSRAFLDRTGATQGMYLSMWTGLESVPARTRLPPPILRHANDPLGLGGCPKSEFGRRRRGDPGGALACVCGVSLYSPSQPRGGDQAVCPHHESNMPTPRERSNVTISQGLTWGDCPESEFEVDFRPLHTSSEGRLHVLEE